MASINPIRYRGYYFDGDTGLYYLKSRYYDPELARFINADDYVSSGQGILGCNMFAYCGNNPVIRIDAVGRAFETVLDVISLTFSIADVVANPANPWAWAGLAGDIADVMIPFVGGIGETIKAVGATRKLVKAEEIVDVATSITKGSGTSFSSFGSLKRSLGRAGAGRHWHHIVEQCQIRKSGFSKYWIHNSINVIGVDDSVHRQISAYYSSIQSFTNGMTFRNWLAGQSFETQYEWGIKVLTMFGAKN